MDKKTKKGELMGYNQLCMDIETLRDRRLEVFTQATKIVSSQSDAMPNNRSNESKIERNIIKLAEIDRKLKLKEERKKAIERELNRLNCKDKVLVKYIYIDKVSCKRVSGLLHKDYKYINSRINKALENMNLSF